ncbi:MAG: hypothetical protein RLZZ366_501 [Pseudomonadota bacterium]
MAAPQGRPRLKLVPRLGWELRRPNCPHQLSRTAAKGEPLAEGWAYSEKLAEVKMGCPASTVALISAEACGLAGRGLLICGQDMPGR